MPQQQTPQTKQPRDPRDSRDPRDPKDPRDSRDTKEQSFKPSGAPSRESQRNDQPKRGERESEIEKRASKMDEEGGFKAKEEERDSDW